MTVACPIALFFPGLGEHLHDLFADDEEVWTPLNRLSAYIRRCIRPNVQGFFQPGVPTRRHAVLLSDGWRTDGFEILFGREKKGSPEIWVDGELRPEASVIFAGAVLADDQVQIGRGVIIESGALVRGPSVIGDGTEVRHGAYVRGNCFTGRACVIGHSTEVKHAIFLDGAKAGHFAYVGDSILGRDVNLGAGTKLANLRFARGNVSVRIDGRLVDTGRRKLGAVLGDNVQTGCNSVTNPGALVGLESVIAPNATVKAGFYRPGSVVRK